MHLGCRRPARRTPPLVDKLLNARPGDPRRPTSPACLLGRAGFQTVTSVTCSALGPLSSRSIVLLTSRKAATMSCIGRQAAAAQACLQLECRAATSSSPSSHQVGASSDQSPSPPLLDLQPEPRVVVAVERLSSALSRPARRRKKPSSLRSMPERRWWRRQLRFL